MHWIFCASLIHVALCFATLMLLSFMNDYVDDNVKKLNSRGGHIAEFYLGAVLLFLVHGTRYFC